MSDVKEILEDTRHFDAVFVRLREMQKTGFLCDGEVEAQGQHVKVHRVLLVAASGYFAAKFSKSCDSVHVDGITAEGLISALVFIYTGRLSITRSNIREVRHACSVLDLDKAVDLCSEYLEKHRISASIVESQKSDKISDATRIKLISNLKHAKSIKSEHSMHHEVPSHLTSSSCHAGLSNHSFASETSLMSPTQYSAIGHMTMLKQAAQTMYSDVSSLPHTFHTSHPFLHPAMQSMMQYQMFHSHRADPANQSRRWWLDHQQRTSQCSEKDTRMQVESVSIVGCIINDIINMSVDISRAKLANSASFTSSREKQFQSASDDNKENILSPSPLRRNMNKKVTRSPSYSQITNGLPATSCRLQTDGVKDAAQAATSGHKSRNSVMHQLEMKPVRSEASHKRLRENDQPLNLTKPAKDISAGGHLSSNLASKPAKREFTGRDKQISSDNLPDDSPDKPSRECPRCSAAFPTSVAMRRHWIHCRESAASGESGSSNNTLSCHRCVREFRTIEEYRGHLATTHRSSPNKNDHKRHYCETCGARFKSNKLLHSHQFTAHKIPIDEKQYTVYSCERCDYVTIYKSRLAFHIQITHSSAKPFACTKCDKSFKTKAKLRVHDNLHSRETHYPCHQCASVFYTASHRRMHVLTSHRPAKNDTSQRPTNHESPRQRPDPPPVFTCYVCQAWSSNTYLSVLQHIVSTHGEELISTDFKCWFCDAVCRDGSELCRHASIHSPDWTTP